jgi:iron complex outermembrane recepter protein
MCAQESGDSTRMLDAVEVHGYLYDRALSEAPASIHLISQAEMNRFNNVSFVPVLNVIPGVKMEERSPASYRLSIRGSSIRSPFGVRNVKFYRNGLPFTDAGGNTYLNLFDFSSIESLEVIKGPGGSLYGAGTGGVVLLRSQPRQSTGAEIASTLGSYGLQRYLVRADVAGKNIRSNLMYSKQKSAGFRHQTASNRDTFTSDIIVGLGRATSLSTTLLFTDVFYETPGGLTREQYDEDPKQARPAGALPSAMEQNASVQNRTGYGGIVLDHDWSDDASSRLAFFGSITDFQNFAIANYERRDERNVGLRTENTYRIQKQNWSTKVSAGAEFQRSASPVDVHENNGGAKGALLIKDDLTSYQSMLFAQIEFDLPSSIFLTLGFSENWLVYDFVRTFDAANQNKSAEDRSKFGAVFSPRIAVLKKLKLFSVYGSVSKGFSPPTLAEVRPSTNVFNSGLKSESGTNVEAGLRRTSGKLQTDITFYNFALDETIVLQRVENGAEYFINAGKTSQRGIELTMAYSPTKLLKLWSSLAHQDYKFKDYVKFDTYINEEVDYSGNALTGVAPFTGSLGADILFPFGLYMNIVYGYTDRIALNDLNDEFADDYSLLNVRTGYKKTFSEKYIMEIFAAGDNLLDEKYSLGNDLNARGRRFYNAAPRVNFSAGIRFQLL